MRSGSLKYPDPTFRDPDLQKESELLDPDFWDRPTSYAAPHGALLRPHALTVAQFLRRAQEPFRAAVGAALPPPGITLLPGGGCCSCCGQLRVGVCRGAEGAEAAAGRGRGEVQERGEEVVCGRRLSHPRHPAVFTVPIHRGRTSPMPKPNSTKTHQGSSIFRWQWPHRDPP